MSVYDDIEFGKLSNLKNNMLNVSCNCSGINIFDNPSVNDLLEPNEIIQRLKSNSMDKKWEGYIDDVKVKNSNKGRHKKEKISTRKKIGNGTSFGSQITLYIKHPNGTIYKIKTFTKGYTQLPGVKTYDLSDSIILMKLHNDYLSNALKTRVNTHRLSNILTNFDCKININNDQIINLEKLFDCIIDYINTNNVSSDNDDVESISSSSNNGTSESNNYQYKYLDNDFEFYDNETVDIIDGEVKPNITNNIIFKKLKILDIIYDHDKEILSLEIHTPKIKNDLQRTKINIFQTGSMLFIGSYSKTIIDRIYNILQSIIYDNIHKYKDEILIYTL